MIITKEEIDYVKDFISRVNSTPLSEIQLPNNFKLSKQLLDDWKYTGLSNWTLVQDYENYNDYTRSN